MKHLKTYEGYKDFFKKIKSKFTKEEDLPKHVDYKELESTLDDCFIDLVDNGFIIDKEKEDSNAYADHRGNVTFGKERTIYNITISKPLSESKPLDYDADYYVDDFINDRPKFKVAEVKDSVLFAKNMIKDQFGINMVLDIDLGEHKYTPIDFSLSGNDLEISSLLIRFDVPLIPIWQR